MTKYPQYLSSNDIYYPTVISVINKKRGSSLQPIFEAFTNSLEAFVDKSKGSITVSIHLKKDLLPEDSDLANFDKITIHDNGVGFNDTQFDRLKMLRDSRKGPSNRGTGRIQFLHFFNETNITSIYRDDSSSTGFKKRIITLSKSDKFIINNNSIIRIDDESECQSKNNGTKITFVGPLDNSDGNFYAKLDAKTLKDEIARHYLALFCKIKDDFPKILIQVIIDGKIKSSETIIASEIPPPDKIHTIAINYSKIEDNKIIASDKKEDFELKAFRIEASKLSKNEIKLISKDEIARNLNFDGLLKDEEVNGDKFLFLLSGKYIDEKDTDTRGQIKLLDSKEFLNQFSGYLSSTDNSSISWTGANDEEILLSDIENITNSEILKLYPEIDSMRKEKNNKIDELREMFLLNQNAIANSKITINDNYEDILAKVYREEARMFAQKDAKFREHFHKIQLLNPKAKDYQSKLGSAVNEFVRDIPLKDKTSLSRYIARRRLFLYFFLIWLKNDQNKKRLGDRVDEGILHNLIFQQHTQKSGDSDLWLINEEFIYFEGTSESYLKDLSYKGKKIFKDDDELTGEEKKYRLKQGGDANLKRTDILLFPKEQKCIIIELKAPDVNVSEHLNQISKYATLIHNLSRKEFAFTTYYGYLLGENIDIDDIRDNDSDFKPAYHLDYLFRPYKEIVGKFGRISGSLYTEILKYSTLLERANIRNRIFFEKLGVDNTSGS
ncbi:MAG: hypothetical protein LBE13_06520 [Bacteroidales bacterium]|jgi:hypothetical protein|nr:hypothetical protein [Bacteroidales bacterium]